MSDYRALLRRPCTCGHLYGDHAPTGTHRCLTFDRRQEVLFGRPVCRCLVFREIKR